MSVVAIILLQTYGSARTVDYNEQMLEAAKMMQRAIETTREHCEANGIEMSADDDPNRTCMIGPEYTPLMTTLGHVDAKRTTTDPAMAGLIVHLLTEAGVSPGDTIAIGSSASFPALLVATLSAAEALDVQAVSIISLGSSTYGATRPEFNLLDIYRLLLDAGVIATRPAAVSLGGSEDVGNDFDSDFKAHLLSQIAASEIPLIYKSDLRMNVEDRMAIYFGHGERRISAFVNAGGNFANLGTSAFALRLEPGLNLEVNQPPEDAHGVIFEMAARNVPVVHLLFIRGLALRYGLTWDPIPLREPGEMEIHADRVGNTPFFWWTGVTYFVIVAALLTLYIRSGERGPGVADESAG